MSKIYYRIIKGAKYQLMKEYRIQLDITIPSTVATAFITLSSSGMLIIKYGSVWDGPSGPTIDTSDTMRCSLIHDALCELIDRGLIDKAYKPYADRVLEEEGEKSGMLEVRAGIWRRMVNMFGAFWSKKKPTNEAIYSAD